LPLPTLGSKGLAGGHGLAAVTRRIEARQSLLQRQMGIGERPDHDLTAFDRNANALIGMQMRFAGDARWLHGTGLAGAGPEVTVRVRCLRGSAPAAEPVPAAVRGPLLAQGCRQYQLDRVSAGTALAGGIEQVHLTRLGHQPDFRSAGREIGARLFLHLAFGVRG